jgi:Bacterial TniB protein
MHCWDSPRRDAAQGCEQYGIELRFRPVRQPNYGGHIERLLGTFAREIHTRAKELLGKLEDLLSHPRIQRMPDLLIVGETNNGKSVLVKRFQQLHPATDDPSGEGATIPVLLIQAPPVPQELRLYHSILEALACPYRPSESAARKLPQVMNLLRRVGLRMLVIDEIHHILAGPISSQRQMLNVLKYLGNELQIPLVGVGTKDAIRAVQTDPQLANRFEPAALPRWDLDRDYLKLLASFERALPLREPSNLSEPSLATRLLAMSEGTIGELSSLLTAAAMHAVRIGRERIDGTLLSELDWTPPSERKRQVERMV